MPPCVNATISIKKICNIIFQKWGGGVKGRLEFSWKFIQFGSRTLPLPSEWRLTELVRNSIHRHVGGARNPQPCEVTPELEAFCPDVQNGPPRLANFLAVYLGNPELAREATLCCEPVTCRPFECCGGEQVFPFFQYFLQLRLTFFQLM